MHAQPDPRSTLSLTAQSSAHLQNWEQWAQRARQYMQSGQIEYALAAQVQALQVARKLLVSARLASHPDHCMAAWVVSHHNIAELLVQRQQLPLAVDYLCDAHMGLLHLLQTGAAESYGVQHTVWRHLRETHMALLHWQRQHGSTAQVDAAVHAAMQESDAAVCRCSHACGDQPTQTEAAHLLLH